MLGKRLGNFKVAICCVIERPSLTAFGHGIEVPGQFALSRLFATVGTIETRKPWSIAVELGCKGVIDRSQVRSKLDLLPDRMAPKQVPVHPMTEEAGGLS